MKPPTSITVGSRTYVVRTDRAHIDKLQVRCKADLMGHTDNDNFRITLNLDAALGCVQETALHEVLHVITEFTGVYDDLGHDEEEKMVNRLAPVLLDVLRRNPKLVKYLVAE